jgi:predicted O-methyltransferase YrrM
MPYIGLPLHEAEQSFLARQFLAQTGQRESLYAQFEQCKTSEDYFRFSQRAFGILQITSEILAFLEFVQSREPKIICEIGTAFGGTQFLLSQALPSVTLSIGIDIYIQSAHRLHYFSKHAESPVLISGSTRSSQTLAKLEQLLDGRKIDLLFIDGDHSYEGVKQDFLQYKHLVAENGLIAFHDIVPDLSARLGIKLGVKSVNWAGGVPTFWQEIKPQYTHWEFVESQDQDAFGIGVIQYQSQ